jgi:hypothetical protein
VRLAARQSGLGMILLAVEACKSRPQVEANVTQDALFSTGVNGGISFRNARLLSLGLNPRDLVQVVGRFTRDRTCGGVTAEGVPYGAKVVLKRL